MAKNRKSSFNITDGVSFGAESPEESSGTQTPTTSFQESSVPEKPEKEQRTDTPSNQGRKREWFKRSCIGFSESNYEFIKRESRWNGMSYSEFLDMIINDYRKSYKRPEF